MYNERFEALKCYLSTAKTPLQARSFAHSKMGMIIGLVIAPPQATVMTTFMGVINISLGAFFVWMFLTQKPKEPDKRKKKRKDV